MRQWPRLRRAAPLTSRKAVIFMCSARDTGLAAADTSRHRSGLSGARVEWMIASGAAISQGSAPPRVVRSNPGTQAMLDV